MRDEVGGLSVDLGSIPETTRLKMSGNAINSILVCIASFWRNNDESKVEKILSPRAIFVRSSL
jgi:hypothetical protein